MAERYGATGGLMGRIRRYVRVTPWVGLGVAAPNEVLLPPTISSVAPASGRARRETAGLLLDTSSGSLASDALTICRASACLSQRPDGTASAPLRGAGVDLSCRRARGRRQPSFGGFVAGCWRLCRAGEADQVAFGVGEVAAHGDCRGGNPPGVVPICRPLLPPCVRDVGPRD
jgi:hypothetical protein